MLDTVGFKVMDTANSIVVQHLWLDYCAIGHSNENALMPAAEVAKAILATFRLTLSSENKKYSRNELWKNSDFFACSGLVKFERVILLVKVRAIIEQKFRFTGRVSFLEYFLFKGVKSSQDLSQFFKFAIPPI